jgi:hypothetical protein
VTRRRRAPSTVAAVTRDDWEAKVERMRAERDEARAELERLRVALDERAANERLRAALRWYGRHVECARWIRADGPCTCGLDAALEGKP